MGDRKRRNSRRGKPGDASLRVCSAKFVGRWMRAGGRAGGGAPMFDSSLVCRIEADDTKQTIRSRRRGLCPPHPRSLTPLAVTGRNSLSIDKVIHAGREDKATEVRPDGSAGPYGRIQRARQKLARLF